MPDDSTNHTTIGRLEAVAFDCPDPLALAEFYRSVIGGEMIPHDDNWVELRSEGGWLAFQRADDHRPPTWPDNTVPQQAHADVAVADLDEGEAAVIARGARKAEVQPMPKNFRVFLDPAGHPFCLVPASR